MFTCSWDNIVGYLTCLPNWHASQTFGITSSIPNLGRPRIRFYFFVNLRRWRLTWSTYLCQIPMSPTPFLCVNNMEFTSCMFTSKVNIHPFLFPFAINLLWFFKSFTKHPLGLNVTYKPCSTIWPTNTKLFVMVKTWNTSFKYFVCPFCMDNGTLPICVMGCVMSSPVSTNPSVFKSLMPLNHSPWLVMWFETLYPHAKHCYLIPFLSLDLSCATS